MESADRRRITRHTTIRRSARIALCSIFIPILLSASTAGGAERQDRLTRIYLNLGARKIGYSLEGKDELDSTRNPYTIRANETAEIWIADPNPLLFKYDAKTELSDTEEHKAVVEFAKQWKELLDRFPASAGSGATGCPVAGRRGR